MMENPEEKKEKPPIVMDIHPMLEARHGSTGRNMDVTAELEYPHSQLSELMQSPCRPEENGYFGATYGIPSEIIYEFEMEADRGAKIDQAVAVIQEHLMDVILSVTFPSICSFNKNGQPPAKKTQDVVITGFRFGREELDMSRTCTPIGNKDNYCNRLSGLLHIYGSDVEQTVNYAQSVINFGISGSLTQVQDIGVQRVETVEILAVHDLDKGKSGLFPFPMPVLVGLLVSGVCIILGITMLCLYKRKDGFRHRKLHKLAQRTMLESMADSFRYFTADGTQKDDVGNRSCSSDISSVQIDSKKGAISKMPNDKVDVEFDPDYASDCGLISETSSNLIPKNDKGPAATMSHPPHYLDEQGRYRD